VFYASINNCVCSYISNFTTCSIDNVDIYSTGEMAYEDNIQNVLQRLHHVGLHYKAVEWQLRAKELVILVILINYEWICKGKDCITTIADRPTLESVGDLQVLVGYTNMQQKVI